jgi:uncharacterized glyoxalase superfamily protein PhnB
MARDLWKAPSLVPSLAYQDVPGAIRWLERAFGFRERRDARLTWSGGVRAWIELDDVLITLSSEGGHGLRSPNGIGAVSLELKVYVDDVDRHFERASATGATILSPPEDGFWGGRIYRVVDLEGHRWEFAQRDRDLDPRLWRLPEGLTMGAPDSSHGDDPA